MDDGNYNRKNDKKGKGPVYSPSVSYNYNPGGTGGSYQSKQPSSHFKHHKKPDIRHKPPSNDRLIKQNDTIIKLLKEIRDRLPKPPMPERHEKNYDDKHKDIQQTIEREELDPIQDQETDHENQYDNEHEYEHDNDQNDHYDETDGDDQDHDGDDYADSNDSDDHYDENDDK